MDYTYEKLRRMMNSVERKGKAGLLKPEEAALGTAAAYATDLMDYARDSGNPLNLTIMQEDVIAKCLSLAHMANIGQGKTIAESRENLVKLLGGYELFAICNSFNVEGRVVEITVLLSVMTPQPRLVIDTLPDEQGKTVRFDVYDAARETVASFQLENPGRNDGMFFAGRMQIFHERLVNELFKKIAP